MEKGYRINSAHTRSIIYDVAPGVSVRMRKQQPFDGIFISFSKYYILRNIPSEFEMTEIDGNYIVYERECTIYPGLDHYIDEICRLSNILQKLYKWVKTLPNISNKEET